MVDPWTWKFVVKRFLEDLKDVLIAHGKGNFRLSTVHPLGQLWRFLAPMIRQMKKLTSQLGRGQSASDASDPDVS